MKLRSLWHRVRGREVLDNGYPGEEYVTGTGQVLCNVHAEVPDCRKFGCVIHHPSPDAERIGPTHWRSDRGIMERICRHEVGHPDPDGMRYLERQLGEYLAEGEGIHGCDGCCLPGGSSGEGPPRELTVGAPPVKITHVEPPFAELTVEETEELIDELD